MTLDALPQYQRLTISRFQLVEVPIPAEIEKVSRYYSGVTLEACRDKDGSYSWAIRQVGLCLDKEGDWNYEPIPSSRNKTFYEMCRFPTIEKALESWAIRQEKDGKG